MLVPCKRKNKNQKKLGKRQKARDDNYKLHTTRTLETMQHLHDLALSRAMKRGEDEPDRPPALVWQDKLKANMTAD